MGGDKKRAGEKDARIGSNARLLRVGVGLSQKSVATRLGVTYQQIQKYERGDCRLSAVMLYELSQLYRVPYERFFDGLEKNNETTTSTPTIIHDRATLKIIAALSGISNPVLKTKIGKVVEILAG